MKFKRNKVDTTVSISMIYKWKIFEFGGTGWRYQVQKPRQKWGAIKQEKNNEVSCAV